MERRMYAVITAGGRQEKVEVGQTLVSVDPQTPLIGGGPVGGPALSFGSDG